MMASCMKLVGTDGTVIFNIVLKELEGDPLSLLHTNC
jgi:hypothetical protein